MSPGPASPGDVRRIAVLRLSSLGDVILTLPVVQALARAYPEARLDYWTKEEYRDVVGFDPAIAHVRALEQDASSLEHLVSMAAELEECDLIVDLHHNLRTRVLTFRQKARVLRAPAYRVERERWVRARWSRPGPVPHAIERYAAALRPLGVRVEGVPVVHTGGAAEAWAESWIEAWQPAGAPVALCPGAKHFTKRWPEAHWVSLHQRLTAAGRTLIYFSLAAERAVVPALAERVAATPSARWCLEPLPRIAALMSRCAAAVTSDSGLMHLAAARGRKVVALFGSTAPELGFAPAGEGHVVLCRHEPCQPCTLHGRESCPKRHFRCMVELGVEPVLAALATVA